MGQGSVQTGELLGRRRRRRCHLKIKVHIQARKLLSKGFPKVLRSWWEIFDNGHRGSTQNFAADVVSIVVWLGEPFLEKKITFQGMHTFPKWTCPKNPEIVIFPG